MNTDSTQLIDYLRAIRRRWRLVVLLALITTGVALALSATADEQYEATAEILLREQEPINSILDPGGSSAPADPERALNTQVELVETGAIAHAARRLLGVERSAGTLLEQLEVEVSSTSNFLILTATAEEPRLAADIANAFAETYVAFRLESARQRYRDAGRLAESQLQALSEEELASPEGRALQARLRDLEITAALQTGEAQLVRRASVPEEPASPRPLLNGALGLFLGLLLGAGAAIGRELFDRRLKEEESIEAFFGLPVIATIPRAARRAGPSGDDGQREAYGLLAANLRFSALSSPSSVLVVTSAGPAEGKTSVTLGLASALSRLGLRVVALEADLRRPAFARYASLPPSAGLTGVLRGQTIMAAELIKLDTTTWQPVSDEAANGRPTISVLPAGEPLSGTPQRMLSGPRMESLLDAAQSLADVVLVDTAPVGTVNDAVGLFPMADAVAVVARLGTTNKDAARRALRVIKNPQIEVAGVIITDSGKSGEYDYYGTSPSVPAATSRD
jgi:Mrp family chromosome partitioning ATPase